VRIDGENNGEIPIAIAKHIMSSNIEYSHDEIQWCNVDIKKKRKTIGSGSYGKVYSDTYQDTEIAIKRTEIHPSTGILSLTELDISRRLYHPNIVNTFGGVISGKSLNLIMVKASCNLSEFIKKYRIGVKQTTRLFHEILCGVEFLHRNGILHMDLKLANILVYGDLKNASVAVSDFGLCVYADRNGSRVLDRDLVTVTYRAPEVFSSGLRIYNRKVDIWSLGIILLRMLAYGAEILPNHESPTKQKSAILAMFGDKDRQNTLRKHLPADISPEVVDLLDRMLSIDPSKRPEISEILSSPIFANMSQPKGYIYQPLTQPRMDRVLDYLVLDSLFQVAYLKMFSTESVFLAVDIYHRSIHSVAETMEDYHLHAICCLMMATKLVERIPLTLSSACQCSQRLWSMKDLQQKEIEITNTLRGVFYPRNLYTQCGNLDKLRAAFESLRHAQQYTTLDLDFYTSYGETTRENISCSFRDFYPTTWYWNYMQYQPGQCKNPNRKYMIEYLYSSSI